jgi:hypothetical protein
LEHAHDHVEIGLKGAFVDASCVPGAVGGVDEGGIESVVVVTFAHVEKPHVDCSVVTAPEPGVVDVGVHARAGARVSK